MVDHTQDAWPMRKPAPLRQCGHMTTFLYDAIATIGIATLTALAVVGFAGGSITDLVDGDATPAAPSA